MQRPKLKPPVSIKPSDFAKDAQLDSFIIPAGDDRGHSTRLQFRCSPAYGRRIDEVVQSKKFPYKTQSDFLRHALDRHLKYLNDLEPDLGLDMARIDVINRIINRQREEIEFMNSIESLNRNVQDLVAKGAHQKARATLREILKQVDQIEDEYLRNSYRDEIQRRFGHLLHEED
ncbi:hypothetical protein MYX82_06770 [Acidobacteria bacterium AH-259-D05]|nr:hypothetical protein [Acidobacteria bacterium AH-259-D05]